MKIPRDVSGAELIKALRKLGYGNPRQKGSHIRITTQEGGEHHEVVPNHQIPLHDLLERLELRQASTWDRSDLANPGIRALFSPAQNGAG